MSYVYVVHIKDYRGHSHEVKVFQRKEDAEQHREKIEKGSSRHRYGVLKITEEKVH